MKKKEEKAINGVIAEFTENKNGVTIKKCCASCKNHEPHDSESRNRKCTKHDKLVDKSDYCGDWCISKQINEIKLRP